MKDKYSDNAVLLITESEISDELRGQAVECRLDWDFRYRQMRLHSTVHFHHCMLEKVLGKQLKPPKTSDIEDGFAFNRYDKTGELTPEVVEKANTELRDHIDKGAEITTYPDKEKEGFRWWECLDYKIPCGGTHIANLNEVGELEIKLTSKKGKPTVNFKLL